MTENLPATILSAEISEIEHTMRVDRPRYNRDDALQARYRGLIEQRDSGPPTIVHEHSEEGLFPILSARELAAQAPGASFGEYVRLVRVLGDWALSFPSGEQRRIVASFDALPEDAGVAAIQEIMARPPAVEPSSERAVQELSTMPFGPELIQEWGYRTPQNMALVRARLWRVCDRLPEASALAFVRWLEGLSAAAQVALYRRLAA